jgi:hypothetical protein
MVPKTLEKELQKIKECCRHNKCLITIIDGQIDDIQITLDEHQEILEDHEERIVILESGSAVITITPVENYSALPDPTTVPGQFYFVKNAQGTSWLPGSWGGTYYKAGLYYSDGINWFTDVDPWQADQDEVDAGIVANEFVTPLTLANATTVSHPGHTHPITEINSFTKAELDTQVSDGNVLYVGDVTSNATHTGEVTGATALTVDKTAITNKSLVTAVASDHLLIADASDSDNLKKVTAANLINPETATYYSVTSQFTTTSASAVAVTGLGFTPAANTKYKITGMLLLRTSLAATGARPGISWPSAGVTDNIGRAILFTSTTGGLTVTWLGTAAAILGTTTMANATQSHYGEVEALLIMGGSPTGDFQVTLATETAGSSVSVEVGSFIKVEALPF